MTDRNDEGVQLGRRTLMLGGLAAGAALTLPGIARAAALPGTQGIPEDAAARAAIVRRMRLRHDAGMVFWWFRGRTYAQQGATLTPVCGMVFGAMLKVMPRSDGGLDVAQYELGFRTDLATGERAEKLRNPLTGEMLEIPFAPVGPTVLRYSSDNVLDVPKSIGGSQFSFDHIPDVFYRAGDMVFFQYQSRAVVTTPDVPDRVLNDMGTIYGPAAEALNPEVNSARAWVQGTDVTDYARWLKMPPGMGTQTLRSIGQKVERFEDMPEDWRAMIAKADPAMAANPLSVFERAEATYRN